MSNVLRIIIHLSILKLCVPDIPKSAMQASVEIVNSKDIQIQCISMAPSVNIDGSVAVTYYMSSNFKGNKIITAKSAAVNLIRPTDDDDIVETPVPEQFLTSWKDGQWVTEMVSHQD
jgi:adenylyl cyclase-associated protein